MAFIRLPDSNVIQTTLQAARQNPADLMAAKGRKDILKAIGWSYDSLSVQEKATAAQTYQNLGPGNLAVDVGRMRAGQAITDGDIQFMVRAISDAGGKGRHTGADGRYRGMQPNELITFNQALAQFKVYLDAINAGTHDGFLDETFPNPEWFGAGQWNTRRQVRNTFQYAYDVVAGWAADNANRDTRIQIDTYLDPQGAAGTSNQTNLLLAESYFTAPLNKRVFTLAHEATHAIQVADYVTLDNGGYIGELRWFDADLDLRQKNASHFQYVIERIQGRAVAIRPAVGGGNAGDVESQATAILCKAWICALNEYSNMYKYTKIAHPSTQDKERATARGKLLGLPVGKTGAGQVPRVSNLDLSGAEARVARLSLLYGGGGPARLAVQAVAQQNAQGGAQVALTVDEILTRVIAQGGGPIRKSSNHAKTVEMIKTLAYLCHQNRGLGGPTEAQQWDQVDVFNNTPF